MDKLLAQKYMYVGLFVLPIILSYLSFQHFYKRSTDIKNELALRSARVAGIKTESNQNSEALKDIPTMEGSNILSYDSNDKSVNVTIETNQSPEKIQKFYEDYFKINGWKKLDKEIYAKDNMKMSVKTENNLAIISLTKD